MIGFWLSAPPLEGGGAERFKHGPKGKQASNIQKT
jgi:hypothetical protein